MPAESLRPALRWLLREIETYLSDEDFVRRVILDPECVESSYATIAMRDWARGRLKSARHYETRLSTPSAVEILSVPVAPGRPLRLGAHH